VPEINLDRQSWRVAGSVLYFLPLLCAVYVLEPWPPLPALCLLALWPLMERANLRIAGVTLVFLQSVLLRLGLAWGIAAGVVYVILAGYILFRKIKLPAALHVGLTISAAIVMSLYQCSGYFAVGAHGAGLIELMRSYRGLGFHPNWRTVLFSTIMLVILITWPRKFKRLSKIVPAGLVGVTITALLNILLNPVAAHSPVAEFPFLRIPLSVFSMLLIFIAWEEAIAALKKPSELKHQKRGGVSEHALVAHGQHGTPVPQLAAQGADSGHAGHAE